MSGFCLSGFVFSVRLAPDAPVADEPRHIVTFRLTKQVLDHNLVVSLFVYLSPSDADFYLQPSLRCKVTDDWQISGKEELTFFAQFENNSNIYAGVRYSF